MKRLLFVLLPLLVSVAHAQFPQGRDPVGSPATGNPLIIGGVDGSGNAQRARVDGSGAIIVTGGGGGGGSTPTGTAGTPTTSVVTVQGIAGSTAVKIDGSAVTQPISATGLPLPTGAATAAAQTTAQTSLTSIDGKLPATLGQKTAANSLPVILSSDGPFATKFAAVDYSTPAIGTAGAAVTKTLAAAGSGIRNVIEGCSWSTPFGSTLAAGTTVTIADGATPMEVFDVAPGPTGVISFPRPIRGTANTAMTITMSAPGGNISGKVNFYGPRIE